MAEPVCIRVVIYDQARHEEIAHLRVCLKVGKSTLKASTTPPPLPTFARYKNLFLNKKKISVLRTLQYETLSNTPLKGKVLDFGGGERADYHKVIRCDTYESVNIDEAMKPTWVTKLGEPLPCPKDHYDTVISLNTIEHIFDARFVIQGIFNALKPGGEFICAVPFLYPIHANPDDFIRPTARWWELTLSEVGFTNIRILRQLWGPFSTGLACSGAPRPFKNVRTHMALIMDTLYIKLRVKENKTTFTGKIGQTLLNHALGFFIQAQK